jgi:hypothetical protein
MELARESWTDDRLDDLARRMDAGFRRVDDDIRELRGEMNGRFDSIDRRFDSLHRAMLLFSGSLVVSLFGLLATFVLTQV